MRYIIVTSDFEYKLLCNYLKGKGFHWKLGPWGYQWYRNFYKSDKFMISLTISNLEIVTLSPSLIDLFKSEPAIKYIKNSLDFMNNKVKKNVE